VIGTCAWDGLNFCAAPPAVGAVAANNARRALNAFFAGKMPSQGIFVMAGTPGLANVDTYNFLRQLLPEFPWTITPAPWQIQAYVRPNQTLSPSTVNLGLWLLYPSDKIPMEFADPAHPPFDQFDKPYSQPMPDAQKNVGPKALALQAAMFMFYPAGKINVSGETPGKMHPNTMFGSWFGGQIPSAYWAKTVSIEMIDFMTKFLTQPNPYDHTIGFGKEAMAAVTVGAGAFVAHAAIAAAQGAAVGAKFGGQYGAAIGAGIGATISAIKDAFSWFQGDPEPPGWVKQLMKMQGIWYATGAWYWMGPPYYGTLPPEQRGWCNRLQPILYRGQAPVDASLSFESTAPLRWTIPTTSKPDYAIFQPRSGSSDPLWTPLDAYYEVMRRIGTGTGVPSTIPWGWIAAGAGALAAVVIGAAVVKKKKAPEVAA